LIRPDEVEELLQLELFGLCPAALKGEAISIKNSPLLTRLNEPSQSG
jgi:hypothetical protein